MTITLAAPRPAQARVNDMAEDVLGSRRTVGDMVSMLRNDAGALLALLEITDCELTRRVNAHLRSILGDMPARGQSIHKRRSATHG